MSGRRYLTQAETMAALRRGADVEQFLGRHSLSDGRRALRWVTASTTGRRFELRLHEVEDVGTDDFLDVAEFPPLDEDEHIGEGRMVADADDPDEVLSAGAAHGAAGDRWVNPGVVAVEYSESRSIT